MKSIVQKVLTVLLMLAVLAWSFFNYLDGKISMLGLCMVCVILGYSTINIVSSIIRDLRGH